MPCGYPRGYLRRYLQLVRPPRGYPQASSSAWWDCPCGYLRGYPRGYLRGYPRAAYASAFLHTLPLRADTVRATAGIRADTRNIEAHS